MDITQAAREAHQASRKLIALQAQVRTRALAAIRQALHNRADEIFRSNIIDLQRSEAEHLAVPLLKRLKFDQEKLERVLEGISALEEMDDPVAVVLEKRELDTGLILSRVSCPIGLVGMIFESRPDALIQMASLCMRSANAVILKGGSEARETNKTLAAIINDTSTDAGLPKGWIQLAESRDDVQRMLKQDEWIDLLIPRGSNEFIRRIMRDSTIPVLGHADGICHIYIDEDADILKTIPIVLDSRMQYVAVCNALETLLVHRGSAQRILPPLKEALEATGCEIRGCAETRKIILVKEATEKDWASEYLDAILAIRIVESMDEAIHHIHSYGSGHTDAIITENTETAEIFLSRVDSADVFHNCSTRFCDGFVYGLGAEVGISTAKIHARGPVGVQGLLSYRWQLRGSGQIIADYSEGRKVFTHKNLKP